VRPYKRCVRFVAREALSTGAASPCGAAGAKLARALYIVSPAVTMSADARNRLCGVYHTAFIRSSLEIRISVREVETLASFTHRTPTERFRAAHSNALRGSRNMKPYWASIRRGFARGPRAFTRRGGGKKTSRGWGPRDAIYYFIIYQSFTSRTQRMCCDPE
jgi:hypothetical protein